MILILIDHMEYPLYISNLYGDIKELTSYSLRSSLCYPHSRPEGWDKFLGLFTSDKPSAKWPFGNDKASPTTEFLVKPLRLVPTGHFYSQIRVMTFPHKTDSYPYQPHLLVMFNAFPSLSQMGNLKCRPYNRLPKRNAKDRTSKNFTLKPTR